MEIGAVWSDKNERCHEGKSGRVQIARARRGDGMHKGKEWSSRRGQVFQWSLRHTGTMGSPRHGCARVHTLETWDERANWNSDWIAPQW